MFSLQKIEMVIFDNASKSSNSMRVMFYLKKFVLIFVLIKFSMKQR